MHGGGAGEYGRREQHSVHRTSSVRHARERVSSPSCMVSLCLGLLVLEDSLSKLPFNMQLDATTSLHQDRLPFVVCTSFILFVQVESHGPFRRRGISKSLNNETNNHIRAYTMPGHIEQ